MAITDPTDIAGCEVWLDFSDTSSLTLSGSQITTAADKSGNGNDFIPIVGGSGPDSTASVLNGLHAAVWNATNTGLRRDALDLPRPTTIFLVGMFDSSTAGIEAIFQTNSGGTPGQAGIRYHPSPDQFFIDAGVAASNKFAMTTGSPWYLTVVFDSASNSDLARLDGVAQFTNLDNGSTGLTGGFTLGRSNASESGLGNAPGSYICELIAYDTALGGTDIADVEAYLVAKWFTPAGGGTQPPRSQHQYRLRRV